MPVRKPGGDVPAGRREEHVRKPETKNQICTKKDLPAQPHKPHQSSPIFTFLHFSKIPLSKNLIKYPDASGA